MPCFDEPDECTADIGPMGEYACHKFPGCGCHKGKEDEPLTPEEEAIFRKYSSTDDLSHLTDDQFSNLLDELLDNY